VHIAVLGDSKSETDETFMVELRDATGAVVDRPIATCTIADDDAPNPPALSVGDARVTEGNTGNAFAAFTVSLSRPAASAVTVVYMTVDRTATASSDYRPASGTLTFPAGQTTQTI